MAIIRQIQSNFNAGELSPKVLGRTDLEKYFNGCETLENYIIMPWGGVTRRPGTKYVAAVKTQSKFTRLIPFEYSAEQAYMLEFGDSYIRFFYNGARVYTAAELITNGTFDTGIAGWTDYSTGGGYIVWEATGQRMEILGSTGIAGQSIATTIGSDYSLVLSASGGYIRVKVGSTLHGTQLIDQTLIGAISLSFTATSTTTYIELTPVQVGPAPRNPWYYLHSYIDDVSCVGSATVLELISPYTEGDLSGLQFAQSADVLFITHPDHMPRKLMRFGHTDWVLKALSPLPPPTSEQYEDLSGGTIKISPAAITGNGVTVLASATVFQNGDCYRLLKYRDGLAIIKTYVSGTEVTVDFVYDFPSTVAPAAGPGTITTVGTALTCTTAHGLAAGDWVRLTNGAQAGQKRRVSAIVDSDEATLASAFTVDQSGTAWSKDKEIAAGSWTLLGAPGSTCTPSAAGVENGEVTLTLSVNANGFRAADVGKYVRGNSGVALITAQATSSATARVLVPFASTTGIPAGGWTLESAEWSAANGYPRALCFFEQRLFFAGTTAKPTTLWGSRTADYENFDRGNNDDDAVVYTIASNTMNHIQWLASTRALLIGTTGGELRAMGGTDSPLAPSNVDLKSENTHGSAPIQPLRIGGTVLFVQRSERKVRDMLYSLQSDGYTSSDLAILAEHIAESGINALDYEQEPYSQVWFVRGDGTLLSMTYNKGQEVVGWARHELGGSGIVESVATIPAPEGGYDQVWLIVRRPIDGSTARYIEYMVDSMVTDAGIVYSGASTVTITGLGHLEGETVNVVADGEEVADAVVASGQITLAAAATTVEAGLEYLPQIVTVRPENASLGTIQGRQKRMAEVWLRVLESRGLVVNGKAQPSDEVTTGDMRVENLGFDRNGRITITNPHPYKSTILAVFGTLQVGD